VLLADLAGGDFTLTLVAKDNHNASAKYHKKKW